MNVYLVDNFYRSLSQRTELCIMKRRCGGTPLDLSLVQMFYIAEVSLSFKIQCNECPICPLIFFFFFLLLLLPAYHHPTFPHTPKPKPFHILLWITYGRGKNRHLFKRAAIWSVFTTLRRCRPYLKEDQKIFLVCFSGGVFLGKNSVSLFGLSVCVSCFNWCFCILMHLT